MSKKHSDPIAFPMHLPREVERLFAEMIYRPWEICREIRGWNPPVDLYETDEAFILEADLPGVNAGDVKVEIASGELVLRGQRTLEKSRSQGQFHTMERCSGQFARRIRISQSVDKDGIRAEFHDGVLRVAIPKERRRESEMK